jgi:hypothetical protein
VSLTIYPVYRTGCGGDGVHEETRAGDRAQLALGQPLAILRHDAGAPFTVRPPLS